MTQNDQNFDIIIVAVPTPINKDRTLIFLCRKGMKRIGEFGKPNALIIFESLTLGLQKKSAYLSLRNRRVKFGRETFLLVIVLKG